MADSVQDCNNVDGIAVPSTSEVTQITEFINEACDQVSIRAAASHHLPEMYTDVSSVNDLKQYFSRPIQIDNLTYNNATRGLITSYPLSTGATKLRVRNFERISGCYGWRATFCFRLQSVATPLQAGRLRLAFQPFFNNLDHSRISALSPISQLPGVDLDITESTSAILRVPFIFNRNYFNFQTIAGDNLGEVAIFAYTPVALGTGAFSPRIAVWHWLEDFEMIAAAPESITLIPPPAAAAALVSPFADASLSTILEAQAGKFSAGAKEEKAIPGNLSNVLAAGSKLVTWAGTKIPFISSYAGPTSWMMREAAKIAASYGWSKPLNSAATTRMFQTVNTYQTNMDGADTTFSLGASVENSVQPLPGFAGTNVDEMSIDYVKSVYSAISAPVLTQFQAPGDLVYSCSLSPKALFFQDGIQNSIVPTLTPNLAFWPSSVFGLANCFNLYRGGFKFRIKMSKTKFHTGRLLLGSHQYVLPLLLALLCPLLLIPWILNPLFGIYVKATSWSSRFRLFPRIRGLTSTILSELFTFQSSIRLSAVTTAYLLLRPSSLRLLALMTLSLLLSTRLNSGPLPATLFIQHSLGSSSPTLVTTRPIMLPTVSAKRSIP